MTETAHRAQRPGAFHQEVPGPVFGTTLRESQRTSPEGFVTYTLKPGVLLRIRGPVVPETDADEPLDIPAPRGMVVRGHSQAEAKLVKGDTPPNDRLWRYVGAVRTPDPRIQGGWRAWKRNKRGRFTVPVMHSDFKNQNPTLGLE